MREKVTNKRNTIYIAKGKGPYENTREVLSQMDLSSFKGKKVLLKPNVGRIAPEGQGITTDKMVVGAAIDAFMENGSDVAIGESPIVGVNTLEAFQSAGITQIAESRNCKLIDLDEGTYTKVKARDGEAVDSFKICEKVLEYDAIVSIPVMKTHMHTGASLSIKNMKGCLYRKSKVELHMLPPVENNPEKPINIAIADLMGVILPHMTIIDGTTGMEGIGPSAGNPKPMGVVIAGFDPFAADTIACTLMGIDTSQVPYLTIGSQRGYGETDINKITVAPSNWREWISPFKQPPENIALEFPNIKVHDKNSCSACQSTLLLLLKRYREKILDYFPDNIPVTFAIGKGNESIPLNTICIGNCTAMHRKDKLFIKGCPPVESEIMTKITGTTSVDFLDGRSSKIKKN